MSDSPTIDDVLTKLDQIAEQLNQPPQRFLGVDDAAVYTGLSAESIRRALSAGKLMAHRPVRGRVLLDIRELESWVTASAGRRIRNGRGMRP